MTDQLFIWLIDEGRQTQQTGVIAEIGQKSGLYDGLRSISANSTDSDQWLRAGKIGPVHFFRRQLQDWLKEPDARISNGKLRSVNSHSHATRAGSSIIAPVDVRG
jgi:hypothetical protein